MAKIGLQLYSIKEEMQRDFFGTLAKVAEAGYDGVEFAGYYGVQAEALREALERERLEAAGVHIPYHLIEEQLEPQMDYANAIGCPAILCPMVPRDLAAEASGFHAAAEKFNRLAQRCRERGLRFLYHIHGHEFTDFGGTTGMDILWNETDPDLVAFEFDTYWVEHAGRNSLEYYGKIGERCPYIHFKDMNNRTERRDTEVGEGILDVPGLVAAGKRAQASWFIVEQEKFDMPAMESIAISRRNLSRCVSAV